jgi:hypothetical protein
MKFGLNIVPPGLPLKFPSVNDTSLSAVRTFEVEATLVSLGVGLVMLCSGKCNKMYNFLRGNIL